MSASCSITGTAAIVGLYLLIAIVLYFNVEKDYVLISSPSSPKIPAFGTVESDWSPERVPPDMSDMVLIMTTCNHFDTTVKALYSIKKSFSAYYEKKWVHLLPDLLIIDDFSMDETYPTLLKQVRQ